MTDECVRYIEKLRDIIADVPRLFEKNERKIEQLEKESSDLIHALELLEFDEEKGLEYIEQLRDVRLQRRRHKDQNMILKPLYDYIKSRPKLLQELRQCHKETEQTIRAMQNRSYTPRIRMELTESFAKQAAEKGDDAHGKATITTTGGDGPGCNAT